MDHTPTLEAGQLMTTQFQFRFVSRGEESAQLVALAVNSLRRCHPDARIILIDANDTRTLTSDESVNVIHLPPADDEIATAVGRGTANHLFYWRHSPQVLDALPASDAFDVHIDSDVLFLRPMDLSALVDPLNAGRIALATDTSGIRHLNRLTTIPIALYDVLPGGGSAGPLLQAGLIFSNPDDDGGLYLRFWELAVKIAEAGHLRDVPYDDMCLVSALLNHGGPLWSRLLPLGPGWNYVTDLYRDPGVFGYLAHYGGRPAKSVLLDQESRLLSTGADAWGTVFVGAEQCRVPLRGPWRLQDQEHPPDRPLSVPTPFALSWPVPPRTRSCELFATISHGAPTMLFAYTDGRLAAQFPAGGNQVVPCDGAAVITVIGAAGRQDSHVHLARPRFD